MPEIKLDRVVSVSSEDKKFPATNLLGAAGSGKWKSATAGENNLAVILQFKKAAKISSLHIGNEGSAFVEVFVGKEAASSDQEWKLLLVASSLMTAADARSNTNLHKVRLFDSSALSKQAREDRWDRAKVICTQPFNKSQAFGLAFVSFITDDETSSDKPKGRSEKLGAYTLNADTDSDDTSRPVGGAMFSDRARLKASIPPPTAAAAVRAAARDADLKVGVAKDSGSSKSPSNSSKPAAKSTKRPSSPPTKTTPKPKVAKSTTASADKASAKPATGDSVSFKEIMKGVKFSLSGFKNPKRSDLREKAVQMGARYFPDWDKSCTHLICAFTSTPKFSQVDGKGIIVTEDWVLDSHRRKKKLPWRDYRLGRARSPAFEADSKDKKTNADKGKKTAPSNKDEYAGSTDVDSDEGETDAAAGQLEATQVDSDATELDSMDTDDEIAAHLAADEPASPSKGKAPASGKPAVTKQSNGASTSKKRPLPVLPDYLLDKVFFLYGNIGQRHNVYRYIHAYGGQVEEYMCDEVQYVITDDSWDDNFDSALTDNDRLTFVKSKWILDIHSNQKFIPHQKYAIVPS